VASLQAPDPLNHGIGGAFGYLGSTITSLVYATFTLIYLAFEGAIMAQAVTALTHIPIRISYVIVSVLIIPLVVYGMRFTARFQVWSPPVWLALPFMGIIAVLVAPGSVHVVTRLHPTGTVGGLTALGLFAVAAAQLSGAAQSGEQGDYLRPVWRRPHWISRWRERSRERAARAPCLLD
jgi:purine-cytosine permease-like protein